MKKSFQGREHSEQTDHEGVSSSVWLRYGEMLRRGRARGDSGNGRRKCLLPLCWPETLYSSSECQPELHLWEAFPQLLILVLGTSLSHTVCPFLASLTKLHITPNLLTPSPLCAQHSAWKMGYKQEARVRGSNMQGQGGMKNKTTQGTQAWSVTVTRRKPNSGLVLVKSDYLTGNTAVNKPWEQSIFTLKIDKYHPRPAIL